MKTFPLLVLLLSLSACGEILDTLGAPYETQYVTDEAKFISAESNQPFRTSDFLQNTYEISSTGRLLLRAQNLAEKKDKIRTDKDYVVYLDVKLVLPAPTTGLSLKACPLTRNWMMGATWTRAHIFSGEGARWTVEGGDFNPEECVEAVVSATDRRVLSFDMSDWVDSYLRGLGNNYGLLLKSDTPIRIHGESAGSLAPRVRFHQ